MTIVERLKAMAAHHEAQSVEEVGRTVDVLARSIHDPVGIVRHHEHRTIRLEDQA